MASLSKVEPLVLVIAIIIVVTFVQKKSTENYNDIKLEKGNFLVYTKYEDKSTKYTKEVPYVNLKADVFKQVNSDILLFCNEYMQKDKSIITYEYDINGIILSLVIKVINNETTYAPEPYFRTYNINLEFVLANIISHKSAMSVFVENCPYLSVFVLFFGCEDTILKTQCQGFQGLLML